MMLTSSLSVGLLGSLDRDISERAPPSALESALRNRGALGSAPKSALEGALCVHKEWPRYCRKVY